MAVAFSMIAAYLLSRSFVPARCAAWLKPHSAHEGETHLGVDYEHRNKKEGAFRKLFLRWEEVKEVWTDAQAREFEKTYLFEIEQQVRGALGSLDHMNQVLISLEHDCE